MNNKDELKRDLLRRINDIENGTVKSKNCLICGKYVEEANENVAFICIECSKKMENLNNE